MLVAECNGVRIEAFQARREQDFVCPQCHRLLILKAGRIVIPHFAHKPPTDCTWATGETRAHLEAKQVVRDAMVARGLRTEMEFVVNTLPGDRRADVMAWSPSGLPVAFELQHTSISLDELERRASAYGGQEMAQIWIPFLAKSVLNDAKPQGKGRLFVERYSPRPFEKWVHGFNGDDGMWMYAPHSKSFWHGRLAGHQIYVEETSWFEAGGEERSAGGFYRWSKRYRELTLRGPYQLGSLRIKIRKRKATSLSDYNWPSTKLAQLTTDF